jgi:hypothetical protein
MSSSKNVRLFFLHISKPNVRQVPGSLSWRFHSNSTQFLNDFPDKKLFFQKFRMVAAETAGRGHQFGVEKRRKISLFIYHYIYLLFNSIFYSLQGNTKSFGIVHCNKTDREIPVHTHDDAGRQRFCTGKYFPYESGINTCLAPEVFHTSGIFP